MKYFNQNWERNRTNNKSSFFPLLGLVFSFVEIDNMLLCKFISAFRCNCIRLPKVPLFQNKKLVKSSPFNSMKRNYFAHKSLACYGVCNFRWCEPVPDAWITVSKRSHQLKPRWIEALRSKSIIREFTKIINKTRNK